jgi:hypothetical protein
VRAVLTPAAVAEIFEPRQYFGSADVFIDRSLADFAALSV